jgi:hypothetical protein
MNHLLKNYLFFYLGERPADIILLLLLSQAIQTQPSLQGISPKKRLISTLKIFVIMRKQKLADRDVER